PTTAIPVQPNASQDVEDATTALRTPQPETSREGGDPEATEKIDTREDETPKRRGGGVSAQDLLRREGRL
ncbi:hypothetical protein AAV95_20560, partial [Mycolicibacterium elephantis]